VVSSILEKMVHHLSPGQTPMSETDWRDTRIEQFRMLIMRADPQAIEEIRRSEPSNPAGVPVWSHDGII
jgi:hypothetical protein